MGNMKTFLFVGFEWWGGLKPAKCWLKGKCFIPLVFGFWIRRPFDDCHDFDA